MIISFGIILLLQIMNIAVYFNNQRFFMAIEINNISINDLLPAKLKPI